MFGILFFVFFHHDGFILILLASCFVFCFPCFCSVSRSLLYSHSHSLFSVFYFACFLLFAFFLFFTLFLLFPVTFTSFLLINLSFMSCLVLSPFFLSSSFPNVSKFQIFQTTYTYPYIHPLHLSLSLPLPLF
ncbi:hypothetical protein BZA77DRAFT_311919 [Pyronema omphalodes]|nr:hypothetical protein BZA77DRAFT_311919 [Pyronema omphalodes]